jgi:hypothetical protein
MRAKVSAIIATVLLAGCTPAVLKEHSVGLDGATSDLRYREMIENLAMVYANRWALPSYSSIYAGAMDVTDGVALNETTTWAHAIATPSGFSSQALDIPASRAVKGTLTLDPMVIPEKLRAMRAACQWAVFGKDAIFPDKDILKSYAAGFPAGNYFGVERELDQVCQFDWLGKSCCLQDVPKNACYCGCYGRCYVWVCPEGMECFSRFVLACQTIARFDISILWQPHPGTKTVKWSAQDLNNPRLQMVTAYVDEYGDLALTANTPAVPPKTRVDNVGRYASLTASINSVIKSP